MQCRNVRGRRATKGERNDVIIIVIFPHITVVVNVCTRGLATEHFVWELSLMSGGRGRRRGTDRRGVGVRAKDIRIHSFFFSTAWVWFHQYSFFFFSASQRSGILNPLI